MIKALFFDLDGTLLDSNKKVPESAVAALKKCREKGIQIFTSTARSDRLNMMLGWTERENVLFDGGVFCNGACIRMFGETRYIFLNADDVAACVETVNCFQDVHMSLHMEDSLHAFNHELPREVWGGWGVTEDNMIPLEPSCFTHTMKILIYYDGLVDFGEERLPTELFEQIKTNCPNSTVYLSDGGRTIQLAPKGMSKFAAIEKLRVQLKLEKDEVAAFGDDVNDIEMLTNYPNSVAMGNAVPQVKEIAAFITKTNDEDGIAYAVEELLGLI